MYLKRIELQGFKSFADKTILEFPNGITTIVGPNGSGKSNISDSIRWVLGEQSAKVLRGSRMEDIIFAGTQSRKSVSFAEVSLVLDNSMKMLPIEYNEVTVTRRVYRSNESEYYINKSACRLKDIQELFMDTGIGRDGYSIISQGKIDEILSSKSEDRRNIFEEAAGIVKYRTRKLEAQKKLDNANINIERLNDVVIEIENNIGTLKNQATKAKQYLEFRDNLKTLEIGLFVNNAKKIKDQLDNVTEQMSIVKSQIKDTEEEIVKKEEQKKECKNKIEEISNSIEVMQGKFFDAKNINEKNTSQINICKERITNNSENILRFEEEILSDRDKIELLEVDKKERVNRRDNLINNKSKFEKELIEKQNELEDIVSKLSNKEIDIEKTKQKIDENNEYVSAKKSDIAIQNMSIENSNKRLSQIENEKIRNISNVDNRRFEKDSLEEEFKKCSKNKEETGKKLVEINNKYVDITVRIDEISKKSNDVENNLRIKDSRKQFLSNLERDHEGYAKSTKAILDFASKSPSFKKGIFGAVGDLVVTEEKYEIAIETALGANMQNVIVETEEDAKRSIAYLRENRLGRATFLPISSMKKYNLETHSKAIKMQGYIGVASDIVSFDKKYENVFENLLGRTVIFDNIDDATLAAKACNYSFRIVTLNGDVLSNTGSMTGGSIHSRQTGILSKSREIELLSKEITSLQKEKEDVKEQLSVLLKLSNETLDSLNDMKEKYRLAEIEYATQNQKLLSSISNIEKLDEYITNTDEEKQSLNNAKKEAENNIRQNEIEIEMRSSLNKSLYEEVEEYTRYNKDKQVVLNNLNEDIVNLKISLTSFDESVLSSEEIFARISGDISRYKEEIARKNNNIESLKKEISAEEENVKQYISEIENSDDVIKTIDDKITSLKNSKKLSNEELEKIEENIETLHKNIEILKDQFNKVDNKKVKYDIELDNLKNSMWEDYEITISMAEEQINKGIYEVYNTHEGNKQAEKIRKQIKELGSINIDSIEEYKQVSERYEFIKCQKGDLEETSSKLKKLIHDLTHIMKEQFEIQFDIINKNFNEVFIELFSGGKAELKLMDESNILECGIEIAVQPPGKKLQNMMLLSGGERAFTAIALLFAILKLKASPFCILDEIEAALDDVNVYRFANYIKKYSNNTQFVIITHRKGTMEAADTVYGVTMQDYGVSKLVSIDMKK